MPCSPVVLTPVLQRHLLPNFCALKLEAVGTSEVVVTSYQLTVILMFTAMTPPILINIPLFSSRVIQFQSLIVICSFTHVWCLQVDTEGERGYS